MITFGPRLAMEAHMSDDLIPTPYGVLVNVATNEPLGPATADQWRFRQGNPDVYLTLPDGVQADVVGGPPVLDCGHTEADHEEHWEADKRRVVGLITWVIANEREDELIDLPDEHKSTVESDNAALLLFPVVAGLAARRGLGPLEVGMIFGQKQAPVAAVAVVHLLRVAQGVVSLNPRFTYLTWATTPDERIVATEFALACVTSLGWSAEDFIKWMSTATWEHPDHADGS